MLQLLLILLIFLFPFNDSKALVKFTRNDPQGVSKQDFERLDDLTPTFKISSGDLVGKRKSKKKDDRRRYDTKDKEKMKKVIKTFEKKGEKRLKISRKGEKDVSPTKIGMPTRVYVKDHGSPEKAAEIFANRSDLLTIWWYLTKGGVLLQKLLDPYFLFFPNEVHTRIDHLLRKGHLGLTQLDNLILFFKMEQNESGINILLNGGYLSNPQISGLISHFENLNNVEALERIQFYIEGRGIFLNMDLFNRVVAVIRNLQSNDSSSFDCLVD